MRQRSRSSRRLASSRSAALLVALSLAGACSVSESPERAVLVGDSLAHEASFYLEPMLGDIDLLGRFRGGTAPCDWLGEDLGLRSDRVTVISFTGNSLTPCMSDGRGGHLQDDARIEKYREDLTALVDEALGAGSPVVVVGQPQRSADADDLTPGAFDVDDINEIYRDLAEQDGVTFVDAGAAVEAPDGSFAESLPCVEGEPDCGPDGTNVVRNADGIHFCPDLSAAPCPVHSSGAYRFASVIADVILEVREGS